jgi:hypothetical protein
MFQYKLKHGRIALCPKTSSEIDQLQNLMQEKSILFSDKPGRTNVTTFKIDTGDASPISQRPDQLAQALRKPVEQEIATLLEQEYF